MAHFAQLDENNVVVRVDYVNDEHENDGEEHLANLHGGVWKRTSYNTKSNTHLTGKTPYRKNYASPGFSYDPIRDAFIPPKPYPSWILNEETCNWIPPIPMPPHEAIDGVDTTFLWNEETQQWVSRN